MILCVIKMKELKMMLKYMVKFFVLDLLQVLVIVQNACKQLKYSVLGVRPLCFQFSVLGSGFSVSDPAPANLNSLYRV